MHALLLNLFLEVVRFWTKKVMSQRVALSSNKDVPFSKSKNSVQVSEPNIFYSSTTSSWKHLNFLWTLTASIHNASLVAFTQLKLFLYYLSASLLLTSESICSGRIQIRSQNFCKRTENFIFPHPTDMPRQSSPHRTFSYPRAGYSQAFLLELGYIQCSIHPMWIISWNVQLAIKYFNCNSLFETRSACFLNTKLQTQVNPECS